MSKKQESEGRDALPTEKKDRVEPAYFDRSKPFVQHNGADFSYVEQGVKHFNPVTRVELTATEKDKIGVKK